MKTKKIIMKLFLRKYSHLEVLLTLYAIWSVFTGFRVSFGGLFLDYYYSPFHAVLLVYICLVYQFFANKNPKLFCAEYKKSAIIFLVGYLFLCIFSLDGFFESFNRYLLFAINGYLFIILNDDVKKRIFDLFVLILSVIFFLSSVEYILFYIANIRLELFSTYMPDGRTIYQSLFNNYIIGSPRFMSLAEEPGVVGTISGLLLFRLKEDKDNRVQYVIFFISGLLSFSFAFYLLLILHVCTFRKNNYLLFVFLFLILYLFYNYFNENVSNLIINRTQEDDRFSRNTVEVDRYISNSISDGSILFGNKASFLVQLGGGAGIKCLLVRHGLLGVISLIFGYSYAYLNLQKLHNVKQGMFLLAWWASFYQREYIDRIEFILIFFTAYFIVSPQKKKL